ncbi:MAG: class I SAM-dependent methyltransferase [Gemmatimonadota bacterium]|nr:class I SAM-dependent methyltransferase [Gemmatimonadota bacterium]
MTIDHREAGRLWDENAEAWTRLSRAGYDIYRDSFNTPAFLQMLPDIEGLRGIDIGCGEGWNTRQVAAMGARITAIDVARRFIGFAVEEERESPVGIDYAVANAVELPFDDATFDFATAFMSMMDIPDKPDALREAYRVLKPGGFLQFSICHPCFDTPHRVNLRNEQGQTYAIEVGQYFRQMNGEILEWIFTDAPDDAKEGLPPFRVARFNSTMSEWLNLVIEAGFAIERTAEPCPSGEALERWPAAQDATVVAYFFHLRARRQT